MNLIFVYNTRFSPTKHNYVIRPRMDKRQRLTLSPKDYEWGLKELNPIVPFVIGHWQCKDVPRMRQVSKEGGKGGVLTNTCRSLIDNICVRLLRRKTINPLLEFHVNFRKWTVLFLGIYRPLSVANRRVAYISSLLHLAGNKFYFLSRARPSQCIFSIASDFDRKRINGGLYFYPVWRVTSFYKS